MKQRAGLLHPSPKRPFEALMPFGRFKASARISKSAGKACREKSFGYDPRVMQTDKRKRTNVILRRARLAWEGLRAFLAKLGASMFLRVEIALAVWNLAQSSRLAKARPKMPQGAQKACESFNAAFCKP
jgi:hypothetical protein